MWIRAASLALLTSVLAAMIGVASADAAGTFFSRFAFASTLAQDGEEPFVQVGRDGTLYLAYRDGRGLSPPGQVAIRTRSPQGVFSTDQQYVKASEPNQFPHGLALAADGTASVLWNDGGTGNLLLLRRFSPAGVLAPNTTQVNATGQTIAGGTLVNRPSGASVVLWLNNTLGRVALREVSAAGVGGPERLLSDPGDMPAIPGQVALAPDGTAIVVWRVGFNPSRIILRTVSPAGVLGPKETVSAGPSSFDPQLAVDASGRAYVAWVDANDDVVRLRVRQPDGTYGAIESVSAAGGLADTPQLGVSAGGAAAIAWLRSNAAVVGRRRAAGGGYGGIVTLAPAGAGETFQYPMLTVESGGNAVVAWAHHAPMTDTIAGRGFRPDSTTDPTTTLSANTSSSFGNADLTNDGVGNVATAASNGTTDKFDVQTGDFGGPEQRSLTAHGSVERGVPATFSFVPFDRQSGIGPSRWVFSDDGTTVQGRSAVHAFKRAGSFTARAISTDSVGNVRDSANAVRVVDTRRPGISRLSLTRSTFRLGAKPVAVTAKAKRRKRSTRLRYTLSEDTRVTISVQRRTIGRRKGRRCRKATRRNRRAKRCVRHVKVRLRTLVRNQLAGKRSVVFTGRVGKRKLKAGRYRFVLQARDPSGNLSAKRTKSFRIAR